MTLCFPTGVDPIVISVAMTTITATLVMMEDNVHDGKESKFHRALGLTSGEHDYNRVTRNKMSGSNPSAPPRVA